MKYNKDVSFTNLIQSTMVGSIIYPPGGSYGPRIQQDFQFVILHKGKMTIEIDEKSYCVPPGYVALLKPGQKETFTFADNEETWHRWIAVNFSNVTKEITEYMNKMPFYLPISDDLNRLMDLMLSLKLSNCETSDVMKSFGYAALNLYASEMHRNEQQERVHSTVLLTKNIIHETFFEEVNLKCLADQVGISPEHLIRLFRRFENTTPIKYLWNYRVARSIELLTRTGLTISEIAGQCGFKTSYHFARTIKGTTGKSPTEIRNASL